MQRVSGALKRFFRLGRPPLSRTRFRSTLDSLLEGCQIIDRDWRYVYLNPAAARHGGRSPEELIGRTMMEAYPGIEETDLFVVLRRCMAGRRPEAIENEFVLPDGSRSWFELAIAPVAEGIFILSLDITKRKQAEAALQETQSRFNAFMDASPTLKWMKDEQGRFLYMNKAWRDVFELGQTALAGSTLFELVSDEMAARVADVESTVLREDRAVETIEDTEYPPGNKRSWNTIRFPFRGPSGGRLIGGVAIDITARKQAEAAVREARSRLEIVIENLEEGLIISDLEGNLLHWNAAATRMHGLAADADWAVASTYFASLFDLVALDGSVLPLGEWPLLRVLRGEAIRNLELRVCHRQGGFVRLLSYSGSVVRYDGDQALAFMTIRDVTDQRRAEEELRTTNERVRHLLEHSSAVMVALLVDHEVVTTQFITDNITRLLGFTPDEAMSPGWWPAHLHPEDRERAMADVGVAIRTGSSRIEYRLRHKDGSYRWIDDSLTVARQQRDGAVEVVAVLTDVTERRSAQDELRESERRFRDMLGNLELIAMMLDQEGCITYCNNHLLRLTGWTREELLGRDWIDTFVPPELRADLHKAFANLLGDQPLVWHYENEILTRSGKRLLVQWNNSVLRSSSGAVIGTASIGEDVTERKNLERQIIRNQRLESLGTLAGGIAHDLNNILMPIMMGATLLKRMEQGAPARKAINNIERSVKRGSDLVKQVLLFARGAETSRAAVDMRAITGELEAMVTSTFPKDVVLEVLLAPDLAPVTGDATQLMQVLLNLCVNARDAMPRGGHIAVTASNVLLTEEEARANGGQSGGMHVVFEVTDSGTGMPKEIYDSIFDPYFTT
jgi:two-component system cell cycle sensor histidine kinase/response regulator CckA